MNKQLEHKDNQTYARDFTRVPNILFESYQHLTKEEILLYIRLRYVYWDTKPRYLSLRELADMTGYSAGALSKMLPRLHKVGLIHAEIRRRLGKDGKEKGNPVYHLTINDVWEENRKFFTEERFDPSDVLVQEMNETCSPNEQDNGKPVQEMNKVVHQMNKPVHQTIQGRSDGEQDCAQNELHKTLYKTTNKTSLKEDISAVADAPPAAIPDDDFSGDEDTDKRPIIVKPQFMPPFPKDAAHPTGYRAVSPSSGAVAAPAPSPNSSSSEIGAGVPPPKLSTIVDKSPPAEPKAEAKWGTRKCLAWFDYWRGGILIGTYKNSQAATCAKGLAEQFDEATVLAARKDMSEDAYWIARGGCDVCEVANNIHKEVNKSKPVSATTGAKTERPDWMPSVEQSEKRKAALIANANTKRAQLAAAGGGH